VQTGNEGHLGLANLKQWDVDMSSLNQLGGNLVSTVLKYSKKYSSSDRELYIESQTNDTLSIALLIARLRLAQDYVVEYSVGETINGVSVSFADRILLSRFVGAANASKSNLSSEAYGKHDPPGALASIRSYWAQADSIMCGRKGTLCS
jgi:hypothetical protein